MISYRRACLSVQSRLLSCRTTRNIDGKLTRTDEPSVYRVQRAIPQSTRRLRLPGNIQVYVQKTASYISRIIRTNFGLVTILRDKQMAAQQDIGTSEKDQMMLPPSSVKGMTVLDRDAFEKTVYVPGFYVPCRQVGNVGKRLKQFLLKVPAIKPVAELDENDPNHPSHKLILLDPKKCQSLEKFIEDHNDFFESNSIEITCKKLYELVLTYKNWSHQEILQAVLPDESDGVAGFSSVGHIIHLNLRDEVINHKALIGQVLLDKVPSAKTVVNKLNVIDNTFRNFQMELLAGEDNMITTTKEHGLSFELDFSKVFWNPRLGTEHQRVVSDVKPKDVVYDVFAGIGPFSVPACKKGCTTHANDLNPESYKWLKHNFKLNKVKGNHTTYNLDGREFIRTIIKCDLIRQCLWAKEPASGDWPNFYIIMNLPAIAVEFLDAFSGLFSDINPDLRGNAWPSRRSLPKVYCYCFSKAEDGVSDVRQRIEATLGGPLSPHTSIRFVRNVATNKDMFCAVFDLELSVLFGSTHCSSNKGDSSDEGPPHDGPPDKKHKADIC